MLLRHSFKLTAVHPSWIPYLEQALETINIDYLEQLTSSNNWLPGSQNLLSAFSLPITQVNYILFGESPYPRIQSANGYAFWDAAVTNIWSATGFSKTVNRATSLRNIIKMLLVADGALSSHQTSQPHIALLDKKNYISTNSELFNNFLQQGFLLLNASLVLQPQSPIQKDARAWLPFLKVVLDILLIKRPTVQLLLFGKIANLIDKLVNRPTQTLYAEHPYNISFITNPQILAFFKPLKLLHRAR